jgi:hypothetical protein
MPAPAEQITPGLATAWNNGAPSGNTVPKATAWDNTAPFPDSSPLADGWALAPNTAPSSITVGLDTDWDNTGTTDISAATADGVAAMTGGGASGNTVANAAAFDNTSPTPDASPLADGWAGAANTPPSANTISVVSWDNNPPSPNNVGIGAAFDNTPATNIVLQGEVAPVNGVTPPASPIAVAHGTTLVAGTNYLVQVGSRASVVTVTLPDPPSLAQRIEIADTSGQAASFSVAVNCGTKQISDTGSTTYTIDRNFAVLVLSYTGSNWKVL